MTINTSDKDTAYDYTKAVVDEVIDAIDEAKAKHIVAYARARADAEAYTKALDNAKTVAAEAYDKAYADALDNAKNAAAEAYDKAYEAYVKAEDAYAEVLTTAKTAANKAYAKALAKATSTYTKALTNSNVYELREKLK